MKRNLPSWKGFIPPMPFSDYQNFMERNSEIERLRRTWKELWKLIQAYELLKDAIYDLDAELNTFNENLLTQINDAIRNYINEIGLDDQMISIIENYINGTEFNERLNSIIENYTNGPEFNEQINNIISTPLSSKISKVSNAGNNNIPVFNTDGSLKDSGINIDDIGSGGGGSVIEFHDPDPDNIPTTPGIYYYPYIYEGWEIEIDNNIGYTNVIFVSARSIYVIQMAIIYLSLNREPTVQVVMRSKEKNAQEWGEWICIFNSG